MDKKLAQVANSLGLTFQSCGDLGRYWMNGDNFSILCRVGGYGNEGRIRFNVSWVFGNEKSILPKNYLPLSIVDKYKLEISVSKEKDADSIVKDIQRRLMPAIQELTPLLQQALDAHLQKINHRQQAKLALMEAAKNLGPRTTDPNDDFRIYVENHVYGTVRQWSGDRCNLELNNLPHETALKILRILSEEVGT